MNERGGLAQTLGESPILAAGATLGPYEIVAAIGAGAMGEVYRARDRRLGRLVAIKVLASHISDHPEAIARFGQEARAIATLNHPNILALHDVGVDSGVTYAVMELLEGETLKAHLVEHGPLPVRRAIRYAVQIADGLGAAHDRGIIHCDLKPENLFLTRDGRLKILDFGISRRDVLASSMDVTQTITSSNALVGTPGYIAPEQIQGQAPSTQSDIFALGVVVHEMLTGTHPFKRATVPETLTAILRESPPPLTREASDLPWAAAQLVEHCLEKQPEKRLRSARDLSVALQAIDASPDLPLAARAPRALRSFRTRAIAASCVVLMAIVVAAWSYVRVMADRAVDAAVDRDLALAQRLVSRAQNERLTRLQLTARLVASFPDLKALFATDRATVRDFLSSYQQRNPGTPILVALAPDGEVLARTDSPAANAPVSGESWLTQLSAAEGRATIVAIDGRPYHAAEMAAEAGGTVFGHVIAAAPVDDAFTRELRDATQDEIVLLSSSGVVATTFRANGAPWTSLDSWRRAGGSHRRSLGVAVGVQRFTAREVPLAEAPALSAVVARSRDEAIEPFLRIERAVLLLGVVAIVVAIVGSLLLARTIDVALRRPS